MATMNRSTAVAYIDMLSCLFAFFVVAFVIVFQVEKNNKGNVEDPAQFLITMEWTNGSYNDIDLLVKNPNDKVVWYKVHNADGMTLDRDDQGMGGIRDSMRREVVSIRTIEAGEYVVNVLFFKKRIETPEKVSFKILKLNPYQELYEGTHVLTLEKEELTVFSFVVDDKGKVLNKNTTAQTPILADALAGYGG